MAEETLRPSIDIVQPTDFGRKRASRDIQFARNPVYDKNWALGKTML